MKSQAAYASLNKINILECNLLGSIIAEGPLCSTDQKELVNKIPLGPNAAIVKVDKVFNKEAYLWRPSAEISIMADVLNATIAWPIHNIELVTSTPREELGHKRSSPPVGFSIIIYEI